MCVELWNSVLMATEDLGFLFFLLLLLLLLRHTMVRASFPLVLLGCSHISKDEYPNLKDECPTCILYAKPSLSLITNECSNLIKIFNWQPYQSFILLVESICYPSQMLVNFNLCLNVQPTKFLHNTLSINSSPLHRSSFDFLSVYRNIFVLLHILNLQTQTKKKKLLNYIMNYSRWIIIYCRWFQLWFEWNGQRFLGLSIKVDSFCRTTQIKKVLCLLFNCLNKAIISFQVACPENPDLVNYLLLFERKKDYLSIEAFNTALNEDRLLGLFFSAQVTHFVHSLMVTQELYDQCPVLLILFGSIKRRIFSTNPSKEHLLIGTRLNSNDSRSSLLFFSAQDPCQFMAATQGTSVCSIVGRLYFAAVETKFFLLPITPDFVNVGLKGFPSDWMAFNASYGLDPTICLWDASDPVKIHSNLLMKDLLSLIRRLQTDPSFVKTIYMSADPSFHVLQNPRFLLGICV